MGTIFQRRATADTPTLDRYDIAHLAGGARRVAETALVGLRGRGVITVVGPRVRAAESPDGPAGGGAEHPVEQALLALCPESRSVAWVLAEVARGAETAAIERWLVAYGLRTRYRRRLTQAGRRSLEAAVREAVLPAYVFEGPAAVPDRRLSRVISGAELPSGLGKSLIRLGKALDSDRDSHHDSHHGSDTDSGSGHSGGGGGGGGGGD
ncbi:TIGR04222 domain-containing membrane protein [Streptomyces sp. GMY02]|uniref:TIGR04222 domain-containing membrane protein n=1 Tax=Streptomyces sp. GMY02 TaxID=1333528 RepID=UPI001C2C563D|nr:TIGR04222 domain-containing membrane protein [Streptomyces sp. GMY02]QXE38650.1 TIGR04222 domain-containing membrane protein [Streptomyces sp. GMY02]